MPQPESEWEKIPVDYPAYDVSIESVDGGGVRAVVTLPIEVIIHRDALTSHEYTAKKIANLIGERMVLDITQDLLPQLEDQLHAFGVPRT